MALAPPAWRSFLRDSLGLTGDGGQRVRRYEVASRVARLLHLLAESAESLLDEDISVDGLLAGRGDQSRPRRLAACVRPSDDRPILAIQQAFLHLHALGPDSVDVYPVVFLPGKLRTHGPPRLPVRPTAPNPARRRR